MKAPKFKTDDVVCEMFDSSKQYRIEYPSDDNENGWCYCCKFLGKDEKGNDYQVNRKFWEYEIRKVDEHDEPMPKIEANDVVNHPNHYMKNGVECIDMIKAIVSDMKGNTAYCVGNVVKYLWRFQSKNGLTDLYKAKKYIEMLIEEQEKEDGTKIEH